jgi:hypothetical protein
MQVASHEVNLGVSASNVLHSGAPVHLTQELLEARLQQELRDKAPHGLAEAEVTRDWDLLQQALRQSGDVLVQASKRHPPETSASFGAGNSHLERSRGNLH